MTIPKKTKPGASPNNNRTRRHMLYAVVITILAICTGYRSVLPVFRSHLMHYLDIGDDRFGLLFSLASATGLVSVLFGGQLVDRWGPRRMIRTCLTGIGCSMLIIAFGGPHFASLAIALALTGVFLPTFYIAVSSYLGRLFPRNKRRILSLNLASVSTSGLLFPLVAEGLLLLATKSPSVTFGQVLHLPFMLVGGLLLAGTFIYRKPQINQGNNGSIPSPARCSWQWRHFLLEPKALFLATLIFMHGAADSILCIWMARFLESKSFAAQLFPPGLVISGFSLAYLLSRGILGAIPDHFGRRLFIILPGLIGGGILIIAILSRNYLVTASGYILAGFFWSSEYPALVSTLMHHCGKRFGAAMAVAGVLNAGAMFLAMNAMGTAVERLGDQQMWKLMLIPAFVFPLIGIGAMLWVRIYDHDKGK